MAFLQNREDRISGGLKVTHSIAQKTYVRVVSPRLAMHKRSSNMCRVKGIVRGRRLGTDLFS